MYCGRTVTEAFKDRENKSIQWNICINTDIPA